MRHVKKLPISLVPILLVIAGLCAALAGVYLLTGLAPTLVVGGALATAVGLLVDV